ncbi:type VII secretion protein EccB [Solwaraspora sp. WMMD406]|uniref:type VII secretion protein EccB n=1 Tax=Solwaraspora sp. WMMD406 TaxID=3016095 RepID=UPI002415B445|nr:type VII secretion protein EccB [Solwaraspora sp. WMMD406]MDG4762750.1 type VII secretion protein EccB [Solwaraspora sp. WMMD406]
MPSRRDQVQSYQFLVQRMTSALVARDPDPAVAPFRRLGGAGLAGMMVAVLCLGAVGVFGFIVPGGATSWRDGDTVILEKETGTRYLFRDGRLHPVLNYASALLAMEAPVPTRSVSRNSLVGAARGPSIGIPNAPDALPDPDRMLDGGWTLCSQLARDEAGDPVTTTVLTVGRPPAGGRDPGDTALLVRDVGTAGLYLIWRDHRHEITDEAIVLEGLTLRSEPVVDVGGAWLNALPAGEPIGARPVAGRGEPSGALPDALVGQVHVVESQAGSRQYYLVERTWLTPLSQLTAEVLLADPATRQAYRDGRPRAIGLDADAAVSAPKAPPSTGGPQPPERRPEIARLADAQPAVCAGYAPGQPEPTVLLDAQVDPVRDPVRTAEATPQGVPLADRVVIEPGYGALVEAMPSPDAPTGVLHLVTDQGYRYPLASAAVPTMLGYGDVEVVALPAGLVVRLPSGPALDPVAAKRSVAG